MKTFTSITEIKNFNAKKGYHFFKPDTMKFFNSRVIKNIFNGRFFITSEQYDRDSDRLFTARMIRRDGQIETIGKFQQFEELDEAIYFIQSLPSQLPEAIDYYNDCYKLKTMVDFYIQCLTEWENTRPEDRDNIDPDSFTGSCLWLMDNADKMDSYAMRASAENWEKIKKDGLEAIEN